MLFLDVNIYKVPKTFREAIQCFPYTYYLKGKRVKREYESEFKVAAMYLF